MPGGEMAIVFGEFGIGREDGRAVAGCKEGRVAGLVVIPGGRRSSRSAGRGAPLEQAQADGRRATLMERK